MHSLVIIAGLASFLFKTAFSAPAASVLCVYMTAAENWQGEALNLCDYPGVCANKMPDGLSGHVNSAGPQAGAICYLYSMEYCEGEASNPLMYPGYANLTKIGFADTARSWMCFNA